MDSKQNNEDRENKEDNQNQDKQPPEAGEEKLK